MNYGCIFALAFWLFTAVLLGVGYIVDKRKSKVLTNQKRKNMIVK